MSYGSRYIKTTPNNTKRLDELVNVFPSLHLSVTWWPYSLSLLASFFFLSSSPPLSLSLTPSQQQLQNFVQQEQQVRINAAVMFTVPMHLAPALTPRPVVFFFWLPFLVVVQNAVIRQAINRLSEQCFDMCVSKPGSSLSSSEASCLSQCAARYLDTSQFLVNRMQQKAKQGSH